MNKFCTASTAIVSAIAVIGCSGAPISPVDTGAAADTNNKLTLTRPIAPVNTPPSGALSESILANGGFEFTDGGLNNWNINAAFQNSLGVDENWFAEGAKSVTFQAGAAAGTVLEQTVPMSMSTRFLLRAAVLTKSASGAVHLACAADGAPAVQTTAVSGNNQAWQRIQQEIEAPASANNLVVSVMFDPGDSPDTADRFWVDHIQLIPLAAQRGKEFVYNGDFNDTPDAFRGWVIPSSIVASVDSPGVNAQDSRCIKVDLDPTVNLGMYQEVKELTPGGHYLLSGYVKCENMEGNAGLEIQHGTRGYQAFARMSNTITGTMDWTEVTIDFIVPEDTGHINIYLRRPNVSAPANPQAPGAVWFDRISLTPIE